MLWKLESHVIIKDSYYNVTFLNIRTPTPRLKIACNYLILYEYEFIVNNPQKENFIIQSAYHNIVEVVSTMLYLQYNVYAHKKLGMNLLIIREYVVQNKNQEEMERGKGELGIISRPMLIKYLFEKFDWFGDMTVFASKQIHFSAFASSNSDSIIFLLVFLKLNNLPDQKFLLIKITLFYGFRRNCSVLELRV
ncbi:hypothetical protein BDC45DRAFT_595520 [Circinella umbellata]|nr:hypothetical protein BDC45DRAFT_595520 [Circinella umbellata]